MLCVGFIVICMLHAQLPVRMVITDDDKYLKIVMRIMKQGTYRERLKDNGVLFDNALSFSLSLFLTQKY
jgi:hypothetical protein